MIKVFTDGSSMNPGESVAGFVAIEKGEIVKESIQRFENSTSARSEVMAIVMALRWANEERIKIKVHTDSKYCAQGFNLWMESWKKKGWKKADGKEIAHRDLWEEIYKLQFNGSVKWVRGHNGNRWNNYIDKKVTLRKNG